MLRRTFIHIPGIGPKTEQGLWKRGIHTWEDFLGSEKPLFSPGRDAYIRDDLEKSKQHNSDIGFFSNRLPSAEMWRLFDRFRHKAVYLDIETSGGYEGLDEITMIGIYDGKRVQSFINGINLEEFEIAIANFDLMITVNGACFDLPFIRRRFRTISLPKGHIDLRFLLRRLNYTGGLKKIEKALGLARDGDIDGMDGYEAVLLWMAYQRGDQDALDRLVRYNTADIVNLEPLMVRAYGEMREKLLSCFGGK
ncbi:MAG: ribonuclease H-like domain-containing protein [Deltaproteobacteria bacterium]|nr:ribonuclease H-like domain-containing protein [Deltaproteobacteria bacterium]